MDASTLGERFTVLSISVMYRGCGIPIAWKIIQARQEGEWCPYWEDLLKALEGAVPSDWKVILIADRGLYAALVVSRDPTAGMAPDAARQGGLEFSDLGRRDLQSHGHAGETTWSGLERKRRME